MITEFLVVYVPALMLTMEADSLRRQMRRRRTRRRVVYGIDGCRALARAFAISDQQRHSVLGALKPMPTRRIVPAPRCPTASPRQSELVTYMSIGREARPVSPARLSLAIGGRRAV